MKKFLFINGLSVVLGAHLLAATPQQANDEQHCSSSESSSTHHRKVRQPLYASAVANGSANMQFVAPGSPIIFNSVLNISPYAVYYNTSTGVFTVTEPGVYQITYGARFTGYVCSTGQNVCDCPENDTAFDVCASIALQVNGAEVAGSEVNNADLFLEGEAYTSDWVSIEVIQTVGADTTIALCAANADLYGIQLMNVGECGDCPNGDTTAFISIKKL